MGEYDFTDNLVTISRFSSSAEAAMARAKLEIEGIDSSLEGEATATTLNHLGGSLVGTNLLVRQGDLRRAREILANVLHNPDNETDDYDANDYDADDWSGEDWSDDDDDLYEEYSEEPLATPPLSRAWRAAVIGIVIPILVLNIYSMWLVIQHRLWEPQPGERTTNWRYYAALLCNLLGVLVFYVVFRLRNLP